MFAMRASTRLRRPLLMVTLLLLALLLVACAGGEEAEPEADPSPDTEAPEEDPAAAEDPVQLRIAYVPATTGLVLHIAQEEGFFQEHGIEAELTEAQNISEIIPTLGQQFEISLGTSTDLIRAGDAGLDVVQITGNTISTEDNPFARMIAREDSGIESLADLEGARVASPTTSGVINMGMLYGAQQEGVDPDTIEVIQVPPPNHPDQLMSGQVDVVQALEPFATSLLEAGHVSLGDPFSVIADPLATNFWIANATWA
ncbi:MAG: ABC transporter substrate-binding protein, partial [Actinomycetota bacterium]